MPETKVNATIKPSFPPGYLKAKMEGEGTVFTPIPNPYCGIDLYYVVPNEMEAVPRFEVAESIDDLERWLSRTDEERTIMTNRAYNEYEHRTGDFVMFARPAEWTKRIDDSLYSYQLHEDDVLLIIDNGDDFEVNTTTIEYLLADIHDELGDELFKRRILFHPTTGVWAGIAIWRRAKLSGGLAHGFIKVDETILENALKRIRYQKYNRVCPLVG